MANIQQAAKWMQEGKKVRRHSWFSGDSIVASQRFEGAIDLIQEDEVSDVSLLVESLLADDWEIAP